MVSRATKSSHVGMGMHEVEVVSNVALTPHLRRVTVRSESLRGFLDDGPDQRFKLLLPQPHQDAPVVPDHPDGWYAGWLEADAGERAVLRTYTVRAARQEAGEMDVDIVVHEGEDGPGSSFAKNAAPGDRVALTGAWAEYEFDGPGYQLVAGDQSALPAVASIVEQMPADARGRVVVEVPGPDDRLDLPVPDGVDLEWLDEVPGRPGAALVAAVQRQPVDERPDYAWVCGEQRSAAAMRRHLVREVGLDRESVMFMGYWRVGGSIEVPSADDPTDDD